MNSRLVEIPASGVSLPGDLTVPPDAAGIVLFAHGSGSSRLSPRNREVAAGLVAAGQATLLFDLLTDPETRDRRNVFDIESLAGRLVSATGWTRAQPELAELPLGYFGASTGAAAALVASTQTPHDIAAIVSRGGRPDLAGAALPLVAAPTLLIVGSLDIDVLALTRRAQQAMRCETQLLVVPGASHLFEEPGTMRQVEAAAQSWFADRF